MCFTCYITGIISDATLIAGSLIIQYHFIQAASPSLSSPSPLVASACKMTSSAAASATMKMMGSSAVVSIHFRKYRAGSLTTIYFLESVVRPQYIHYKIAFYAIRPPISVWPLYSIWPFLRQQLRRRLEEARGASRSSVSKGIQGSYIVCKSTAPVVIGILIMNRKKSKLTSHNFCVSASPLLHDM